MSVSARDFHDIVRPQISAKIGGGDLVQVEGQDSQWDTLAAVDAWQILPDGAGMRALAARVQWTPSSFQTWTVRRSLLSGHRTEWPKISEIDPTILRPALHIQGYIDTPGGQLVDAACIRTSQLVQLILGDHYWIQPNGQDGTEFACVSWDEAERQGMEVWRV